MLTEMDGYQVPSHIFVLPRTLGATVQRTAEMLLQSGEQTEQANLLYCEKYGGFQCGTCAYATPVNKTHGRCAILRGSIHLTEGCCVAWTPDETQLHRYRTPHSESLS